MPSTFWCQTVVLHLLAYIKSRTLKRWPFKQNSSNWCSLKMSLKHGCDSIWNSWAWFVGMEQKLCKTSYFPCFLFNDRQFALLQSYLKNFNRNISIIMEHSLLWSFHHPITETLRACSKQKKKDLIFSNSCKHIGCKLTSWIFPFLIYNLNTK